MGKFMYDRNDGTTIAVDTDDLDLADIVIAETLSKAEAIEKVSEIGFTRGKAIIIVNAALRRQGKFVA
jgi:hypothetical protein